MAVYKDKNGTWYVSARYDNWQGEHARKVKRGFKTKKDAMEWERDFLLEKAGSLDMTFEAFVELYKTNLKERLKQSTWQTKISMLSERKKRMVVAICAEEELSSIEWARLKKDKWVNRSISCPEYVQNIYKMMGWNKDCRYKVYGHLSNSERGLVLVFDLASAVMFDPLPEEYFDKRSGKMKKRINKYYPDEIRMKLGRSYSDYEATQRRSSFESLSGYMDTTGSTVASTVSDEAAAAISIQEQERKREALLGTIIGNGGEGDGQGSN